MNRYKLLDILPETLTTQFDFVVSYKTVNYSVFDTAFFVQEVEQHFGDRIIRLSGEDPTTALVALFGRWKASRSANYARRMYALSKDYEPLDNYDRTETRTGSSTTTHGETVTRTHANTDTRTNSNNDARTFTNYHETNTKNGAVNRNDNIYGVNSANPVPSTKSQELYNNVIDDKTTTGSYTDAHTGTITDAHTGTITDAHTGEDETEDGYTLRAYGNIGVTTSAEMLTQDLAFLARDIALTAICDFIDRYTFYIEEVEL